MSLRDAAPRRTASRLSIVLLIAALLTAAASTASAAPPPPRLVRGPLATAVMDPTTFAMTDDAPLIFGRVRAAGARYVRLVLTWSAVAPTPDANEPPAGFDPSNPADPAYRWSGADALVTNAVAEGLIPILSVQGAPAWADGGPGPNEDPDPVQYGLFAKAAATRYSGSYQGLPEVRYWQAWNEPNVNIFFAPQFVRGRPAAPAAYRAMVNSFADAVHSVSAQNSVIAGSLSPFTVTTGATVTIGPLRFMRDLLCMSNGAHPHPTCDDPVHFDIWSHHPYTSGGPTHHAYNPDDVSLGDMGEMRDLLLAAAAAGHVVTSHPLRFWVTEFSWDTKPPDPKGVPIALQARWTSEALYRLWQTGVSLVTWWKLRDEPLKSSPFQSGLYYRGRTIERDRPKATLEAFRFPFVAYSGRGRVAFWGRTPTSTAGTVTLYRRVGSNWSRVASAHANRYGIFRGSLHATWTRGFLRARFGSEWARAFSLTAPPDRAVTPFG